MKDLPLNGQEGSNIYYDLRACLLQSKKMA